MPVPGIEPATCQVVVTTEARTNIPLCHLDNYLKNQFAGPDICTPRPLHHPPNVRLPRVAGAPDLALSLLAPPDLRSPCRHSQASRLFILRGPVTSCHPAGYPIAQHKQHERRPHTWESSAVRDLNRFFFSLSFSKLT